MGNKIVKHEDLTNSNRLPATLYVNTPEVIAVLKEIERLNLTCADAHSLLVYCAEHLGHAIRFKVDEYFL